MSFPLNPFNRLFRSGAKPHARTHIPADQVEGALENLCQPPFTPDKFQRIADLLIQLDISRGRSSIDNRNWKYRPRTYTVLRNIASGNHGQYMDSFVDGNYVDFHLPFDARTLPGFLDDHRLRNDFLEFQHHVLCPEARSLEIGGEHQLFAGSADAHFLSIEVLGQGGFGQVDKVLSKLSFHTFARKRVPRRRDSVVNIRRQNDFIKEVEILKKLSHRHLVDYVGSYTDNSFIAYLMRPVARWNLFDFLLNLGDPRNEGRRRQVQPFYGCLASAIGYLHDQSIRHTDITTRNVLVAEQGKIYLSDFGTATDFSQSGKSTTNDMIAVSIEYIAPEVARRDKRNKASDMWSLGVVFLEITTVLLGNDLTSFRNFMAKNAKNKDYSQSIWANLPTALDWLAKIMSPYVDSANESITWVKNLLQDDPKNRSTAKNLMVDIRQTLSFRQFCCFRCWHEFESGSFEFETPLNPQGFNQTMKHATAAEVSARAAALFEPQLPPALMDSSRSQSIENWITDSTSATVDARAISILPWDGYNNRPVHRRLSLESLAESMDETAASYTTAIPSHENRRYTTEPTWNSRPGGLPEEDFGVNSGLGYVVEDDRSSGDEDTATKDQANLARGFIIEEDSSGSETSGYEETITLESSRDLFQYEDKARPLVEKDDRNFGCALVPSFCNEDIRESQSDDFDDYERQGNWEEWAPDCLESVDRKYLTAATNKQLVLYHPNRVQQSSDPRANLDRSNKRPDKSHKGLIPGFQGTTGASEAVPIDFPRPTVEFEVKRFANKASPVTVSLIGGGLHPSTLSPNCPPAVPKGYQEEYQCNSTPTPSNMSDDVFLKASSGGSCALLTIPSREKQHSGAVPEMSEEAGMQEPDTSSQVHEGNQPLKQSTNCRPLNPWTVQTPSERTSPPKKTIDTRKEVRWGETTIEEIPRVLEACDPASIDQVKSPHADKHATVEDTEDTSEIEAGQNRGQQDSNQPGGGSGPNAKDILPTEPFRIDEGPSTISESGTPSRSSKSKTKSPKKANRHAQQPLKTVDMEEAAHQPKLAKRVPKSPPSPTLFMEDARKAGQHAKSIATSQMTSRTKQALAGYNINRWVDHTNKLLERYCARGSVPAVRALLSQKCNPGTKAKPRRDPLLNAIRGASARHAKVVRALLDHNVNVHITAPRHYNKTPLHIAVENPDNDGYINMVHDMVFAGVDPNAKDRNGECALEKLFKGPEARGLEKYRLDALALLLLSEAKGGGTQVNIRMPATRDTPLHLAVRRRSPMAAAMLLHKGADVNAANASGLTPLLSAALMWRSGGKATAAQMASDDEQMLDLLVSQPGIKLDELAGTQKRTALHLAVLAGMPLAVEILLEKGADPKRRDADGKSALELVRLGRETETVDDRVIRALLRDMLLSNGARK